MSYSNSEYTNGNVLIRWSWEHLQTLYPQLSNAECQTMLEKIAGDLQDRLVELGWETIEDLVEMKYGITVPPPDSDE